MGKMVLLWKNDVIMNIINYNELFIDCYVSYPDTSLSWRGSCVYGYCWNIFLFTIYLWLL